MRRDGPLASESIFIPDVDAGEVVVLAERGVDVVVHVVVGSHSVAQILKYVS